MHIRQYTSVQALFCNSSDTQKTTRADKTPFIAFIIFSWNSRYCSVKSERWVKDASKWILIRLMISRVMLDLDTIVLQVF